MIENFKDNQFFSVGEYVPMTYAYNKGGYLYEVNIKELNPLDLFEKQERMKKSNKKTKKKRKKETKKERKKIKKGKKEKSNGPQEIRTTALFS